MVGGETGTGTTPVGGNATATATPPVFTGASAKNMASLGMALGAAALAVFL
jgi:hypothetical protein